MASIPALHIGFVLFPDMTQLDFTGPAQVLTRMGNTTIELVAKSLDPIPTDAGFTLQPTATFADRADARHPVRPRRVRRRAGDGGCGDRRLGPRGAASRRNG